MTNKRYNRREDQRRLIEAERELYSQEGSVRKADQAVVIGKDSPSPTFQALFQPPDDDFELWSDPVQLRLGFEREARE